MKPDVNNLLSVAALHLMTTTAAALGRSYDQANIQVLATMLLTVSEEFDRGAARRIAENAAIRRLFAETAPAVNDPALRARLEQAASGADESYMVTALEQSNATLRALLIDLHVHVETLDTPAARQADEAIWRELVASTERRRISMGAF